MCRNLNIQEQDYFTPEHSLIGSISELRLYDEGSSPLVLAKELGSMNDARVHVEGTAKSASLSKELTASMSEKDDSDYCIIRAESETKDGWLVVSDD